MAKLRHEFMPGLKLNVKYNNTMGYWEEKKEKIKQKYPFLTDDDLLFNYGKEKEMVDRLGFRLGLSIEEMRDIIKEL